MTAMHSLEMTTQCSDQTFIRTGISFSTAGNTLDISEGKQKEFSFVLVVGMQGWRSEILLEKLPAANWKIIVGKGEGSVCAEK